MNLKKLLPILLLIVLALATLAIKRCNKSAPASTRIEKDNPSVKRDKIPSGRPGNNNNNNIRADKGGLDRRATDLFFTKHARCRMKCRHITQEEVKDVLAEGTINYNKSDLQDPKGPTYAVEGNTDDGQHVRIIFAPKQRHLTVVTVIDLENEYACNCD